MLKGPISNGAQRSTCVRDQERPELESGEHAITRRLLGACKKGKNMERGKESSVQCKTDPKEMKKLAFHASFNQVCFKLARLQRAPAPDIDHNFQREFAVLFGASYWVQVGMKTSEFVLVLVLVFNVLASAAYQVRVQFNCHCTPYFVSP